MSDASIIRTSETPRLVKVGDRRISTRGWCRAVVQEHLEDHVAPGSPLSTRWCDVGCLAKVVYQRNSATNRGLVRERIADLFRGLLDRGKFLVIEYNESPLRRSIKKFKLFETAEGEEAQYAKRQIEKMRQRREMSQQTYEKAISVLGS